MINPGKYNIEVKDRTTLEKVFYVKDSDGNAFNLTGYTVAAGAEGGTDWIPNGYVALPCSVTDAAAGKITMLVPATTIGTLSVGADNTLPNWDMLITETATSKVTPVLEGTFKVLATYTQ